jgi:hypothetical protein
VVVFSGGALAMDITNLVTLSPLNKFTAAATNTAGQANKLALSVNTKTGKLTGTFAPDGDKPKNIAGAVLQNSGTGQGFFQGTSESGAFLLQGY